MCTASIIRELMTEAVQTTEKFLNKRTAAYRSHCFYIQTRIRPNLKIYFLKKLLTYPEVSIGVEQSGTRMCYTTCR